MIDEVVVKLDLTEKRNNSRHRTFARGLSEFPVSKATNRVLADSPIQRRAQVAIY
jgi:hypothetical protein